MWRGSVQREEITLSGVRFGNFLADGIAAGTEAAVQRLLRRS